MYGMLTIVLQTTLPYSHSTTEVLALTAYSNRIDWFIGGFPQVRYLSQLGRVTSGIAYCAYLQTPYMSRVSVSTTNSTQWGILIHRNSWLQSSQYENLYYLYRTTISYC